MIMIQCNDDLFVSFYDEAVLKLTREGGLYNKDEVTIKLDLEKVRQYFPTMKFKLVKVEIKRTVLKG